MFALTSAGCSVAVASTLVAAGAAFPSVVAAGWLPFFFAFLLPTINNTNAIINKTTPQVISIPDTLVNQAPRSIAKIFI